MTNDLQTLPSDTKEIRAKPIELDEFQGVELSLNTTNAELEVYSHVLSKKPLRRPRQYGPTGEQLKRIAKKSPPPPEWFEGEEEKPF